MTDDILKGGSLRRPVIGVTTQTLHSIHGIPEGLPASWVMNQRYFHAVTRVGAVPWMIPLYHDDLDTLREIYERLDGLLIPGGVDMDPATYGEEVLPECGRLDPARDAVELQLTRWAMADEKPVLGLCRGAQVINVAAGGSLYQDVPSQVAGAIKHDYYPTMGFARDHRAHPVDLLAATRLADVLGGPAAVVNSMHHQSVKRVGGGLVVSAVASDGVIEAVEGTGSGYLVGVQWHPEMFEEEPSLFGGFIAAAREFHAGQ